MRLWLVAIFCSVCSLLVTALLAATLASSILWVLTACAAVLLAFLVGLGVGERARRGFDEDIVRRNQLLGEQNHQLCQMNLLFLRELKASPPRYGDGPGSDTVIS